MVEKNHPQLSERVQCELLAVNRNRLEPERKVGWRPHPEDAEKLELMKLAHSKDPTMGARQLACILTRNGYSTTRWEAGKMMAYLGLRAIYCKPRTTVPAPQNAKYPYLLSEIEIESADQVWSIDITYIPWKRSYVYLTAIIDWHTRAVLSWRVSNTMDVSFCLEALEEAVAVAGTMPEILNTDQGSQFTGKEWIDAVELLGIRVSMDGKGRWMDNVIIERLWRSVKHEWVLLHDYETLPELNALLEEWIERYNTWRPHTANGGQTPWQAYRGLLPKLEIEDLRRGKKTGDEILKLSAPASSIKISNSAA